MAEEIISSWDSINDLVEELVSLGRTYIRIVDAAKDPVGDGPAMDYRLEDANGNAVAFPLTLVSDTTFGAGWQPEVQ